MMGKYIAIEGIDGVGKTTICKLITSELKNSILIKEPSDSDIGIFIRNSLNDKKEYMSNPFISSLLFFSDRILLKETIRDLRTKYELIISDRCFLSTYAYQKALIKNEEEKNIFDKLFAELLKLIEMPDMIVILDVDVNVAIERLKKDNRKKSLYENKEFLIKVAENYRNFELDLENVYLIDANRNLEEVKKDVLALIQQL